MPESPWHPIAGVRIARLDELDPVMQGLVGTIVENDPLLEETFNVIRFEDWRDQSEGDVPRFLVRVVDANWETYGLAVVDREDEKPIYYVIAGKVTAEVGNAVGQWLWDKWKE